MSDEDKVKDNLKSVIDLVDKKIRFVKGQVPLDEDHFEKIEDWKEKLFRQRKHLVDALEKLEEEDGRE